jgi:hypothetical protein
MQGQARIVDKHVDRHGTDLTADPRYLIGTGQVSVDRAHRHRVGLFQPPRELTQPLPAPGQHDQIPPVGRQPLRICLADTG